MVGCVVDLFVDVTWDVEGSTFGIFGGGGGVQSCAQSYLKSMVGKRKFSDFISDSCIIRNRFL